MGPTGSGILCSVFWWASGDFWGSGVPIPVSLNTELGFTQDRYGVGRIRFQPVFRDVPSSWNRTGVYNLIRLLCRYSYKSAPLLPDVDSRIVLPQYRPQGGIPQLVRRQERNRCTNKLRNRRTIAKRLARLETLCNSLGANKPLFTQVPEFSE